MANKLQQLAAVGTSPWLDNIRRGWLVSGEFRRMVDEGVVGVTSNPTIFQKAISQGNAYDEQVKELMQEENDPKEIFLHLAVRDVESRELARRYGVVDVDAADRVVGFVEKPDDPPSTLAATALYLYHRSHVPLVAEYLATGNPPDQPGRFVEWLYRRQPVYAYRFSEGWFDIGDREQLLEADNRARTRLGLPVRAEYAVDAS